MRNTSQPPAAAPATAISSVRLLFDSSQIVSATAAMGIATPPGSTNMAGSTSARLRKTGNATHAAAYVNNRLIVLIVNAARNVELKVNTSIAAAEIKIATYGVR